VIRALLIVITTTHVAAASSHCREVSPIVGRQHCSKFGRGWATERLMGMLGFELVTTLDHVQLGSPTDSGTVATPTMSSTFHSQLAPGAPHSMWALGGRFWFGYRGEHLTLGLEFGASATVVGPTTSTQVGDMPALESRSADLLDLGARFGVHTRVGPFALGALVLVGPRFIEMTEMLPGAYTTCDGANGRDCGRVLTDTQLVVAPRLRVDYWLTPILTFGASVGFDVIHGSESVALSFTFHGNAFDGS
jgi:hypothetical protein